MIISFMYLFHSQNNWMTQIIRMNDKIELDLTDLTLQIKSTLYSPSDFEIFLKS